MYLIVIERKTLALQATRLCLKTTRPISDNRLVLLGNCVIEWAGFPQALVILRDRNSVTRASCFPWSPQIHNQHLMNLENGIPQRECVIEWAEFPQIFLILHLHTDIDSLEQASRYLGHCRDVLKVCTSHPSGLWASQSSKTGLRVRNRKCQILAHTSNVRKRYWYAPQNRSLSPRIHNQHLINFQSGIPQMPTCFAVRGWSQICQVCPVDRVRHDPHHGGGLHIRAFVPQP